ncbi:hypothetical protein DOTSEDRAFT_160346 [Dothistroma septosporum NZE10]|uniref:Amidase domain-containing protein n=1 Tax=Dothistroma septosporum (strain NZE10 / CBS 128990) TaxID=675120 RepID=M2YIE9_DOTSN|nr:hypothetical protein DOTSEDRAFT_160346 [Dothistroma septosporum NZE10]
MMLIQTVPLPRGSETFEKKRQELVKELHDSIPKQYHLPETFAEAPPLDVTDVPRTCGILNSSEIGITEDYDATSLAQAIASKKLTAVSVATAFAKRAAIAHQLTCCLTQFFKDEAIERAKYLDDYLAKHGKPIGPLHGVPISVKEHMAIAGHYSSYGYLSTRVYDDKDSLMIKILRDAGAVFYVKTNQPQGIMHLESDGFLGRVNNPYDSNLSAGGSTGGEAALIAMRGSILGIGTDIGGSIRGPAAFCGIFGFKPTTYTLTMKDFLPSGFAAELNVLCSTGPMARSLRDMDLFIRILKCSDQHLHDPRIIPLPWTGLDAPIKKPTKIGIMINDGVITPQPPVLEALQWVQKRLAGNENFILKPYRPYNTAEAMKMIGEAYWPDAGLGTKQALAATGEPMHPLTKTVLSNVTSSFTDPYGPEREKTATEISDARVARDAFRCAFVEDWNHQDIDVVLAPCFVGPASKHDTAYYWNYTALWNWVDYPAVVLPTPVKAKSSEVQRYEDGYEPLGEKCKHVKQMWEEGGFKGAPVNVQIVGRRYCDNELFGVLGQLQEVCHFQMDCKVA